MIDMPTSETLADTLKEVVGHVLSSVEFVEDYVQLRFDGPCVTASNPPAVTWGAESFGLTQAGDRDALCRRIGCRVERTEVNDQHMRLASKVAQ